MRGRRRDDDLAPLVGLVGHVDQELLAHLLGALDEPDRAARLAPQLGVAEDVVAEAVVVVMVGVDDPADRARQLGQVGPQLFGLAM